MRHEAIKWNPYNLAVQDHRDGTIHHEETNYVRAKLGLPVPFDQCIGVPVTMSSHGIPYSGELLETEKIKWFRLSDVQPPIKTDILILVNGEIHEGYMDSVVLMGNDEPTSFHTLYTNSRNGGCGSAQHTYWGDDPYWMPIPCEKPKQIKSDKPKWDVWSKK